MRIPPGRKSGSTTHLFRGAPTVRGWSKYQETVNDWTLCGIHLVSGSKDTPTTEDSERVNCEYCKDLMKV